MVRVPPSPPRSPRRFRRSLSPPPAPRRSPRRSVAPRPLLTPPRSRESVAPRRQATPRRPVTPRQQAEPRLGEGEAQEAPRPPVVPRIVNNAAPVGAVEPVEFQQLAHTHGDIDMT
ncbi:hypothetical protein FRC09_004845 [Ceratobasidium sp. 395]|nr:hypothetical protein FRC09_004845 [Ceratobasidium sp. 395]